MRTPTFETRPAFCVAGCGGAVVPHSPDIGTLWQEFVPRIGEVSNRVGVATYGLCCPAGENTDDPNKFIYIAGVAVRDLNDVPDGMIGRQLPESEYAVFAHEGGLGPALGATFQEIFNDWLPSSGYQANGIDFEFYDERFNPVTNEGTFYIYVPIVPN